METYGGSCDRCEPRNYQFIGRDFHKMSGVMLAGVGGRAGAGAVQDGGNSRNRKVKRFSRKSALS